MEDLQFEWTTGPYDTDILGLAFGVDVAVEAFVTAGRIGESELDDGYVVTAAYGRHMLRASAPTREAGRMLAEFFIQRVWLGEESPTLKGFVPAVGDALDDCARALHKAAHMLRNT